MTPKNPMMHRTISTIPLALIALVAGLLATIPLAAQPAAPDLTGTWEGFWRCETLGDGVPTTLEQLDVVLEITHISDTEVRASTVAGLPILYNGFAVGWQGEPARGAATFVACDTDPVDFSLNEILSVRFDTTTGTMRGFSTFNERLSFVGSACRWELVRVDTADPQAEPCG